MAIFEHLFNKRGYWVSSHSHRSVAWWHASATTIGMLPWQFFFLLANEAHATLSKTVLPARSLSIKFYAVSWMREQRCIHLPYLLAFQGHDVLSPVKNVSGLLTVEQEGVLPGLRQNQATKFKARVYACSQSFLSVQFFFDKKDAGV